MVAFYSQGNFFATPTFSSRVAFVPNAGMTLLHVSAMDAGNYTVLVTGHDASGASFERQRTIWLQVSDTLATVDHHLHAGQQATAEWSHTSGQFHAVLTCGLFTYLADPPVSVTWLTPDGQSLPSTEYSQGYFKLFLRNPVTAGKYSCMIANDSLDASCSHGQGQRASLDVDGLLTRVTLIEARLAQKEAELAEKDSRLDQLNRTLLAQNEELTALKEHAPLRVAFTARLTRSQQLSIYDTLVLDDVLVNDGNAYNPSTGRFRAPCNGSFFFAAYAVSQSSSYYSSLSLRTNSAAYGQNLFLSETRVSDRYPQSGSLQGVVHLLHGEEVWVVSEWSNSKFWSGTYTAFSGFLLYED